MAWKIYIAIFCLIFKQPVALLYLTYNNIIMLKYKIAYSSHTKGIYNYMICKQKLLHCNANINFNKICLREKIVPKYAYVKIPTITEAARKTKTQAQTLCIKNEIKFLYKGKQQLHLQLYQAHIHNANIWGNIEQSIEQKSKQEMEKVYLKKQKIANMTRTQTTDTINNNTKHTRVENYTNIQFTYDEIQFLNKGLK
jgi:hypothetical protein